MSKRKHNKISKLWFLLVVILFMVAWEVWLYADDKKENIEQKEVSDRDIDVDALQQVVMPEDIPSEIVKYPGYRLSFNSNYHLPNWVAWELTKDESQADVASRKNSYFSTDVSVNGCGTTEDYRNSGYDRGHMCPAGDMKWSQEAMDACHYLTNICPQDKGLNSGSWNTLEQKCRNWAVRDSSIVIICGPVLSDKITRTIGDSRIAVPERFFKVIIAPYANPIRAIGFVMPNSKVPGGLQATAMSVDEVEEITGFDFFSILTDDVESKIESDCNFPKWSQN